MTDERWVIVDPEDRSVYGPYDQRELRLAMLEDLCDGSTAREVAEYKAMSEDAFTTEYLDTTGTWIAEIYEPTDAWRQEAAIAEVDRAAGIGVDVTAHNARMDEMAGPCGSGWTGDRCTLPLLHDGPHSNDGPVDEAAMARRRLGFEGEPR